MLFIEKYNIFTIQELSAIRIIHIFHVLDILTAFIGGESLQVLPLSRLLVSVKEWTLSYLTMCSVLETKIDSLIVLPTKLGSTTAHTLRMPVSGVCQFHVSDSFCLCLCHRVG